MEQKLFRLDNRVVREGALEIPIGPAPQGGG